MQAVAKLKFIRISPLKARLVAKQIQGMPVERALNVLSFSPQRASAVVKKVLESAIANAEHNEGADIDELKVSSIYIDEGPTHARMRARAKGRGTRILKRISHVTVAVGD